MNSHVQPFDLGDIFVTRSVTQTLLRRTIECALQCHARFAAHVHPSDSHSSGKFVGPHIIRSTHWCWDYQEDLRVSFEVMTLRLESTAWTVVYLTDNDEEYGSLLVTHSRLDPDKGLVLHESAG